MLLGIVIFHKCGTFGGIRYMYMYTHVHTLLTIIPSVAVCAVVMETVVVFAMETEGFLLCAVT